MDGLAAQLHPGDVAVGPHRAILTSSGSRSGRLQYGGTPPVPVIGMNAAQELVVGHHPVGRTQPEIRPADIRNPAAAGARLSSQLPS